MSNYIDRDELLKYKVEIREITKNGEDVGMYCVPTGVIMALPTVTVEPVVCGRWVKNHDHGGWHCPRCNKVNMLR